MIGFLNDCLIFERTRKKKHYLTQTPHEQDELLLCLGLGAEETVICGVKRVCRRLLVAVTRLKCTQIGVAQQHAFHSQT